MYRAASRSYASRIPGAPVAADVPQRKQTGPLLASASLQAPRHYSLPGHPVLKFSGPPACRGRLAIQAVRSVSPFPLKVQCFTMREIKQYFRQKNFLLAFTWLFKKSYNFFGPTL
ncbi:hypothetical protein CNY67_03715 [Desulfovibrio sp. G11]|nr:hypothetical protein CNY67_03715 [Desulfovibrio sp. G11]